VAQTAKRCTTTYSNAARWPWNEDETDVFTFTAPDVSGAGSSRSMLGQKVRKWRKTRSNRMLLGEPPGLSSGRHSTSFRRSVPRRMGFWRRSCWLPVIIGQAAADGGRNVPNGKPKKKRPAKAVSQRKPNRTSPDQPEEPAQVPRKLDFRHSLNRVRVAANHGNQRAQQAIRECVKNNAGICAEFGSVGQLVETALITQISSGEILTSAAITQQAVRMRQELAGPAPTVLTQMAVERVVATWLALQGTEMQFLHNQTSVHWARYWLARQAQADKLYRAAVRSLVLVRELLPATPQCGPLAHVKADRPVAAPHDDANGTPTSVFAEEPVKANGHTINRIAALAAFHGDNASSCTAAGSANGKSRLNGHRLTGLLGACGDG